MGVNTGALYIIFIMLSIFGMAHLASGPTPSQTPTLPGPEVVVNQAGNHPALNRLQLYNFIGATITPPATSLCKKGGDNIHPEAIIAIAPAQASAVKNTGQIKMWVSDDKLPPIAPNEKVTNGGKVRTPGDRQARAPDNYLWGPQLYVFPETVENGGKPYFPSLINGGFTNGIPRSTSNVDILPPYALPYQDVTVEFTWNVEDIGLTQGPYNIQFVAHDGSGNLAVKCTSLRVYIPSESQNKDNKLPL